MVILLAYAVEKASLNELIISFAFITFNTVLVAQTMSVTFFRYSRFVNCKVPRFQCHSHKQRHLSSDSSTAFLTNINRVPFYEYFTLKLMECIQKNVLTQ
jgi:hypothetical protein